MGVDAGPIHSLAKTCLHTLLLHHRDPVRVVFSRVDVGQGRDQSWVVMADPEGNEFCVQDVHPPHVRAQWLRRYEAYQQAPTEPAGGLPEPT